MGLRLVYLATSSGAVFSPDYADVGLAEGAGLAARVEASSQKALSMAATAEYLAAATQQARAVVLVDNTSAQEVADAYAPLLQRGIHVVTPNKKAFAGTWEAWQAIFAAAAASGAHVYHESSCGAGLPLLSTLRDLVDTGDVITRIEGIFSGTLSFLFNSFSPVGASDARWSAEVAKAKALGYTEPDPRDDLNGMDVARKLTILARLAGLPVASPAAFPVQSLIPAALASAASGSEFLARLPEFDGEMEAVKAEAAAAGKVVRYVGSVDVATQTLKVGLQSFERSHPFAALQGSDNIFSIYTERYGSRPLIIQGAGAGGEVTAMGVTADLLKVLSQV